ncbi:MAG: hypothetical protein AAF496_09500 [Pseudomonadota bacterium]
MPSLDHHVMMALKLDRWSQEHNLRAFEIEREIFCARQSATKPKRKPLRRFSLGNLKLIWGSTG